MASLCPQARLHIAGSGSKRKLLEGEPVERELSEGALCLSVCLFVFEIESHYEVQDGFELL